MITIKPTDPLYGIYRSGFWLREPSDHIVELMRHDKLVAIFNQTRVTPEDIIKTAKAYERMTGI